MHMQSYLYSIGNKLVFILKQFCFFLIVNQVNLSKIGMI